MALNPDFQDLLRALNQAEARYLLVGAHAVMRYTWARATKDLDLWIEASADNALRVFAALRAFGAPLADLTETDLGSEDVIFQIGVEPDRVDILTTIDGVSFAEAWLARSIGRYGDIEVPTISREHLIQNKRAAGRPQDLLDLKSLGDG